MKRNILFISMLLTALFLTGCCLKHEWIEASCEEPRHCAKCGKVSGEPLGHEWIPATCTNPETCSRCQATNGDPLGHTWVEATCTSPKTCSVCNATEGEPIEHNWICATLDTPKTCADCGATEGNPITITEKNYDNIFKEKKYFSYFFPETIVYVPSSKDILYIHDYDGNLIKQIDLDPDRDSRYTYSVSPSLDDDHIAIITTDIGKNDNINICFYDQYGELIKELNTTVNVPNLKYIYYRTNSTNGHYLFYSQMSVRPFICVDPETLEIVEEGEIGDVKEYKNNTKFTEITVLYYIDRDYLYVWKKDYSAAGFTDLDLNEIKLYKDATPFNILGYSLVSDDRENYSLIDKDFNIIAENCLEAKASDYVGYTYFCILQDGKKHYICVE